MTAAVERDRRWMRRAVQLARRADRRVRPNPPVGCVIVRDEVEVGAGYHRVLGGPHAEIEALRSAGSAARGATVYVSLEPCAHHGRTPPCVDALLQAGVARVVIGARDPHPVAAGGLERLEAAGVEVRAGVDGVDAAGLLDVFTVNTLQGRAFVQLKVAVTLDGRVAASDGSSRWISGPAARRLVHRWRAAADAVVVGSGTVLRDDPALDARSPRARCQPDVVVLDRRLRTPPTARLWRTRLDARRVWIDTDEARLDSPEAQALRAVGAQLTSAAPRSPADPGAAMRSWAEALHRRGHHHVFCEPGPSVAAALVAARLVDRLDVFVAPKLLGAGPSWLKAIGVGTMADARALRLVESRRLGQDMHLRYAPQDAETAPHDTETAPCSQD